MIIFINIVNDDFLSGSRLRYWLIDHCQKWIITEKTLTISVIANVKSYNRLDNATYSLKNFLLEDEKKM